MIDVSDDDTTRREKLYDVVSIVSAVYPRLRETRRIYGYMDAGDGKYDRISRVIAAFDYCDTLFCNTCGDEIDHLYRFVRAIAKNAGLQIIPVSELRAKLKNSRVDTIKSEETES